jgi:hypothetical protein
MFDGVVNQHQQGYKTTVLHPMSKEETEVITDGFVSNKQGRDELCPQGHFHWG